MMANNHFDQTHILFSQHSIALLSELVLVSLAFSNYIRPSYAIAFYAYS